MWGTPQKKRAAARISWRWFASGPVMSTPKYRLISNRVPKPRFRPKSGEKPRNKMAEREGFEPPLPFQVITLSRRAPSTAQPPLQQAGAHCVKSRAKRQVI